METRRPYLGDELYRSEGTTGFLLALLTIPGQSVELLSEEAYHLVESMLILMRTGVR